ncbi:MAG: hypothetical protein ACXVCD_16160 [Pseudobdellovibrionaceae bacterium]
MSGTTSSKVYSLVLIALLICSCSFIANAQIGAKPPRVIFPKEVPKVISAIPNYTTFGYSGLSFFNKKLYASSNIGLLEFEGEALSKLYKWYDRDDVIEGPWLDVANNYIWVLHDGISKLVRYDGKAWEMTEIPRPREDYTRGDILEGFRGVGTPDGFWLEGGRHAWRWVGKKSVWEPIPMPYGGFLVRIIPLKNTMLLIMRHELMSFQVKGAYFKSDTIHYYAGQWKEVPNKTGKNFFAEQTTVIGDVGYVLTRDGHIFRVTSSEITRLEAQNDCEAVVTTTSGNLLASFRYGGIYECADGWRSRFPCPYPPTEAEHWTHLSENSGQVAFAIISKPQMAGENQWKHPGQTTLWTSSGGELRRVSLGGR